MTSSLSRGVIGFLNAVFCFCNVDPRTFSSSSSLVGVILKHSKNVFVSWSLIISGTSRLPSPDNTNDMYCNIMSDSLYIYSTTFFTYPVEVLFAAMVVSNVPFFFVFSLFAIIIQQCKLAVQQVELLFFACLEFPYQILQG